MAIEGAFYDLMRGQELGVKPPLIRCWHSLRNDQSWDWSTDRQLPCIDIRCSPPVQVDGGATLTASCSIKIKTNGSDDKDHAQISALEEAIQTALDTIYSQSHTDCTGAEWVAFVAAIKRDFALVSTVGGIEITQGEEPSNDEENPVVGFVVTVHYSRADY
jgi:hypothetical protein